MAASITCQRCLFFLAVIFLNVILDFIPCVCADDINGNAFSPDTAQSNTFQFATAKAPRYLLYDVNSGEGFNLRRDVYMRVANLVKALNDEEPWILVLPPWGRLYHWKTPGLNQIKIPWATFFDISSLSKHIPVIEFHDYLKVRGDGVIDEVYFLQAYVEGWTDGKWDEKMDVRPCIDPTGFVYNPEKDVWESWFFGYEEEVYAKTFKCLSIQANAGFLKSFLLTNTTARAVMLDRAEEVMHGDYGEYSSLFWHARRSMRYSKELRKIGDEFRKKHLDSDDERDKTKLTDSWRDMETAHGDAVGGPYICSHIRRKDYLYAHKDLVPSLKGAATQLKKVLEDNKLKTIFISSDMPIQEFNQFTQFMNTSEYTVVHFEPSQEILKTYRDGGVSIIDQWICAHARYFIGTCVSTFSYRIQEDREILGFTIESTANCLCSDTEPDCEQPGRWPIVYKEEYGY